MPLTSLFNPAGGLRYHLRALRYSTRLWQPFRQALADYLLSWPVSAKTLIMVGPSGGYCLPVALFERFERLVCLETDPLARVIFRRRLMQAGLTGRLQVEFLADDYLLFDPRRLVQLVESSGDAALLFCNVLGQLRFLLQTDAEADPRLAGIRQAVARVTEHRAFVSFHDRVSGRIHPSFAQPLLQASRLSDEALICSLFAGSREISGRKPELLDHLTEGFFPATLPHAYFAWQITPRTHHIIEAVALPHGWSS